MISDIKETPYLTVFAQSSSYREAFSNKIIKIKSNKIINYQNQQERVALQERKEAILLQAVSSLRIQV